MTQEANPQGLGSSGALGPAELDGRCFLVMTGRRLGAENRPCLVGAWRRNVLENQISRRRKGEGGVENRKSE